MPGRTPYREPSIGNEVNRGVQQIENDIRRVAYRELRLAHDRGHKGNITTCSACRSDLQKLGLRR